jgi:hypothetical protein
MVESWGEPAFRSPFMRLLEHMEIAMDQIRIRADAHV